MLCLAAGDYPLNGYLSIRRDGFTLRGSGTSSQLRLEHGIESPVLVIGDDLQRQPTATIRHLTVEDLAIIGGGHGGSEYHPARPWLTNSGVVVRAGQHIQLRRLDVAHCRSAGILTEYHSRDVLIADSQVRHSAWDGISLNRAGATRITGNTLSHNVAAGLTTEYLEDSEVSGNLFADNGSHGIYLADAYHNRVSDNRFERNRGAGVYLTCSIRTRNPTLCWDHSMSRGNRLEHNVYTANGYGYLLGVDSAANCSQPGFEPNLSFGEVFRGNPNSEPDWSRYGYCLRYDGSRSE